MFYKSEQKELCGGSG